MQTYITQTRWLMLTFVIASFTANCDGAKMRNAGDAVENEGFTFIGGSRGLYRNSRGYQRLEELEKISQEFAKLPQNPAEDTGLQALQRAALKKELERWQITDDKFGRAVASGLAGDDWKALEDERIENIWEGIQLGGALRVSRACSNVLSKKIEATAGRVLGGSWDFFINKLIDGFESLSELLLHGGKGPFEIRQVEGLALLVKNSFEDLERLLRDGLKDSLRGRDMTLRTQEDEGVVDAAVVKEQKLNAWLFLIGGYNRQFEFLISYFEEHAEYYKDGDKIILFYEEEIKVRIRETIQLLSACKSLKDFDMVLDSNKSLVSALKKNILNLFDRLIELVKPQQDNFNQASGALAASKSSRSSGYRDRFMDGYDAMADDEYPHSLGKTWG